MAVAPRRTCSISEMLSSGVGMRDRYRETTGTNNFFIEAI
jgi:hypothetical protein